jgi:chromosome partitioning protein
LKTVTMLNQKGGVGKTSCCHHLAGTLAAMGRRVLLVDFDPQSSLTQGLFGPARTFALDPSRTALAILRGDSPYPEQLVLESGIPGVGLVAGSEAAGSFNKPDPHLAEEDAQRCLAEFLAEAATSLDYEIALIDCPPNLYLCSWAALVSSDFLMFPMQPEDYGAQGIAAVRRSIAAVQAGPNPGLELLGYLLTMVGKKKIHQQYEAQLREVYGPLMFAAMVPEAVAYVEAISNRQPIAAYSPKSAAAKSIAALADEFLARLDAPALPVIIEEAA